MTIPEIIQKMVKQKQAPVYAKVTAVNNRTCDVTPLNDETPILDVRLAASDVDGILITPAVNSIVGVVMINEIEGYVALYSEIDSIQYGNGANEGLVKVVELTSKLNTIEQDLNNLKIALSGWTPVSGDGGATLKTALASYYAATLTETTKEEIQNNTITHGDL